MPFYHFRVEHLEISNFDFFLDRLDRLEGLLEELLEISLKVNPE